MRGGKNGYSNTPEFDFRPLGKAVKRAREARGITREQLAEMLDYAPRHIQAIENEGQHPSFQLLAQLAVMFDISVDQYLFPERSETRTTLCRQLSKQLEQLEEWELTVVEAAVSGLQRARLQRTGKQE